MTQKRYRQKKRKGFSLLELLVYLGIFGLMSIVLSTAFISLARGRAQNESRSEVQANARFAFAKIQQDIASASAVVAPSTGSGSVLQLTVGGSSVVYDVSNGQLRRTLGAGSPELITGTAVSVNSIMFTRADNYNAVLHATSTTIQTQLSVKYNTTSPEWAYTVTMQSTESLP